MRLRVLSDIHLGHFKDDGAAFVRDLLDCGAPIIETLVIAGDFGEVGELNYFSHLAVLCQAFEKVILIPGNHEFYNTSIPHGLRDLRDMALKLENLEVLYNDVLVLEGQRILGTTLWFEDQPENMLFASGFNDFNYIRDFRGQVYVENKKALAFLEENLRTGDIVVTHHMPTNQSVSERYKTSKYNRFFVCDMDTLIGYRKPKLWIHGHTHSAWNYVHAHADTRILCNPLGYPHERSGFVTNLTIEV